MEFHPPTYVCMYVCMYVCWHCWRWNPGPHAWRTSTHSPLGLSLHMVYGGAACCVTFLACRRPARVREGPLLKLGKLEQLWGRLQQSCLQAAAQVPPSLTIQREASTQQCSGLKPRICSLRAQTTVYPGRYLLST